MNANATVTLLLSAALFLAGCSAPGPLGPAAPETAKPSASGGEKTSAHAPVGTAVSAATFESEVLAHKGVVVVDFWASWCAPCRLIAVTLKELSSELPPSVKLANIDVDKNTELAKKWEVDLLPTLMLFKDGKKADQLEGARGKDEIKAWIEKHSK
ncbi:MAG TPA: thioredoxin [Planctomycetota bacterium]|nr:thioredoxin [Planctomycetota bacterium]